MNPFTSKDIVGLRVLLVDNEIFIREMGSDVLSMLGCIPSVASDGREAWDMMRTDPSAFDVIISDYNMPEMTGIDLASNVLKDRPNMPFIISTGFASGFTEKQAEDLGISCILQKPYVIQQLKDAIVEAVTSTTTA
ncbi:response regulator [Opitutales bacterium]|jgi:two-component system, cell cycle sensor histidine kinase and response regulator CckA|nr:response regulator [Opitutales bacterium]